MIGGWLSTSQNFLPDADNAIRGAATGQKFMRTPKTKRRPFS